MSPRSKLNRVEAEQVQLKDGSTATLVPVHVDDVVASDLMDSLLILVNDEIEKGDTFPHDSPLDRETIKPLFGQDFYAVLVSGNAKHPSETGLGSRLLGSFFIRPNSPGHSSHVCNAGFLVQPSQRGKGIGGLLGKKYIELAKKLGYEYSMFNLVYATNVASLATWDRLGFERIGVIKGAGKLKGYPGKVDAVMFGMDLTQ